MSLFLLAFMLVWSQLATHSLPCRALVSCLANNMNVPLKYSCKHKQVRGSLHNMQRNPQRVFACKAAIQSMGPETGCLSSQDAPIRTLPKHVGEINADGLSAFMIGDDDWACSPHLMAPDYVCSTQYHQIRSLTKSPIPRTSLTKVSHLQMGFMKRSIF